MKNILIILILLSGIIFESCINDGPYDDCEQYYFSDEFKAYTFFNEGSYWIYQDTLHNKFDSTNLIYQSIVLIDHCDYNTIYQEILEQHFHSSFFQTESDYFRW